MQALTALDTSLSTPGPAQRTDPPTFLAMWVKGEPVKRQMVRSLTDSGPVGHNGLARFHCTACILTALLLSRGRSLSTSSLATALGQTG